MAAPLASRIKHSRGLEKLSLLRAFPFSLPLPHIALQSGIDSHSLTLGLRACRVLRLLCRETARLVLLTMGICGLGIEPEGMDARGFICWFNGFNPHNGRRSTLRVQILK